MTSYQAAANPYELESETWWVQQWVDLLNSYRFKKRLERGRRYAREGHILKLDFKESKVFASVQGTAADPYKLSIWIERFADEDWAFVIDTLSQKAIYSAQLLAGEMPADIESVFTANGLSLFPFTLADVHSKCDCPDPKNPCKHIAAVYYQLADAFREEPFVLFQLRGRTKEQIIAAIRERRKQQVDENPVETVAEETEEIVVAPEPTSQTLDLENFWQYDTPLDSSLVVITPAEQTVLDLLGPMPLPASDAQVLNAHFTSLYQAVAQQAMMSALS
ncbi:SWIM zinc finger family protein [Leptolyngbya cf. ectocarpi LEGE 11479]|uniref:SWIM zinc finger family protein n=1 Tax=Leptolyngbya cf. ectocarpi LEGE 11479 TaxID=1828722 RepID=A0A928ZXR1_LEPEC|nr:SWIM zinc finger family protein [Leptolyngbya ectocarpi]MBE9069437.1 SWIM zinc finger family protein [Leptolyngbya cf. ectocarpi LEGE 11479]